MEVLEQQLKTAPDADERRQALVTEVDERAARRSLRRQIAKLERDLSAAFVSAYPRAGVDWTVPAHGGPRMLNLGELERVRDDLAQRLKKARIAIAERADFEESNRLLLERMMLDPARHKFVRVAREDVGTPGCGHYHVRPRLGLIGMLMGWWQVKLSSGCPLPEGLRRERRGPGSRQAPPLTVGTSQPQTRRVIVALDLF